MKCAVVVLVLTAPFFLGCHDQKAVTGVTHPSGDFLDGRIAGGNPHFFFLPPLVGQPAFSGVFNPQLQPVVDICQLNTSVSPAVCASGVGAPPHINPGPVVLDVPDQLYHVNWDTQQPQIDVTQFFRIQVLGSPGGLLLGLADIAPVINGSFLKNVNTGQFIGLVDGRTLPIQFRIELGAFLADHTCTDCAEQTVTNNGATVVTNTGFAGAQLQAGWLASPSQVVVTIERLTVNDGGLPAARCITSTTFTLTQFQGCYRFKTVPLATFATNVTVGICADVPAGTNRDFISLFKVEETEGAMPQELPNVPAPFVSCGGFASVAPAGGWWGNLAGGFVRHLETLLTPTRAFAFHLGAGGSTCCFSIIGWALPAGTLINFDATPSGAAILPGTVINQTYPGVTFSRTLPGAFCGDANVYVNNNGPLPGGGFGFGSGDNVVTICPLPIASDFSENSGGRIKATFTGAVHEVCIHAYVTGFQPGAMPGATAFLQAFNADGGSLGSAISNPNAYGQKLCVTSTAVNISSVQFAGTGAGFAIFDNMIVF